MQKNTKIAKLLSLVVAIAAVGVMIGWIFDIGVLKSISTAWISMKFNTAIAFLLSGITLYFIARAAEGEFDKAQVVLSITSLIIVLFMGMLFFSAFFGVHTGIEDLFIKEPPGSVKTITPGRPSMVTMLNFILIAAAAILTMWNSKNLRKELKAIGFIIAAIGLLAVIGYIIDAPHLYYYIEGINTAMACNTAILFVLLGIGLLCL